MSDDEQHTPTSLTGHQLGTLGLLRVWKTNTASRNDLIRKGRSAELTHDQIAEAMGLSRPTVASVLNSGSPTTDGRFDLDKFEATFARRHAQAREAFWDNESADLPPTARPVSWHATLIEAQWDTGDPTSDSGVEPMVESAVKIMRTRLHAPMLVRRVRADQARALGFGSAGDDQVGIVAVHYELAPALMYVRHQEGAPQAVVEQQDAAQDKAERAGVAVVEMHQPERDTIEQHLDVLCGHHVTVTLTQQVNDGPTHPSREVTSTHTGVLHKRRSGTLVLLRSAGDLASSITTVRPYEVDVLVDHGQAQSASPETS